MIHLLFFASISIFATGTTNIPVLKAGLFSKRFRCDLSLFPESCLPNSEDVLLWTAFAAVRFMLSHDSA